jgi:Putative zinc-finger
MNCAEMEILICDYVDGALTPDQRALVDRHLAECPACAELARDSAAAVGFIAKAADVEPPPELVTRILFERGWSKDGARGAKRKPQSTLRRWLSPVTSVLLQPRFAMGMCLTVLSLAMVARPVRQLKLSDIEPAKVWAGIEDRTYRSWQRTVKFYENLKWVYQIQTTLHEWQQQDEDQKSEQKTDDRKLPVKDAPREDHATPPAAAPK